MARGQRQGVAVQNGLGNPPVQSRTSTRSSALVKVTTTSTPEQYARAFDDVYDRVNKVESILSSLPFMSSGALYVKDISFINGNVDIQHRFGGRVRYMVVNHRGAYAGVYRPTSNLTNENTLTLTSTAAFTADVLVWRS